MSPRPLRSPGSASPARRMASVLLAVLFIVAACTGGGIAPPRRSRLPRHPQVPAASSLATSTPSATAVSAFPTTLTDDEGTAVTLKAEPHTIVSLAPATTETLFALGVGDRVKGKSQDVFAYPPQAGDVPDVASFEFGRCREDRRPVARHRLRGRQLVHRARRDRQAPQPRAAGRRALRADGRRGLQGHRADRPGRRSVRGSRRDRGADACRVRRVKAAVARPAGPRGSSTSSMRPGPSTVRPTSRSSPT